MISFILGVFYWFYFFTLYPVHFLAIFFIATFTFTIAAVKVGSVLGDGEGDPNSKKEDTAGTNSTEGTNVKVGIEGTNSTEGISVKAGTEGTNGTKGTGVGK